MLTVLLESVDIAASWWHVEQRVVVVRRVLPAVVHQHLHVLGSPDSPPLPAAAALKLHRRWWWWWWWCWEDVIVAWLQQNLMNHQGGRELHEKEMWSNFLSSWGCQNWATTRPKRETRLLKVGTFFNHKKTWWRGNKGEVGWNHAQWRSRRSHDGLRLRKSSFKMSVKKNEPMAYMKVTSGKEKPQGESSKVRKQEAVNKQRSKNLQERWGAADKQDVKRGWNS